MDIKQFYIDLAEWVLTINQKSAGMNPDEYWKYILHSAGELSDKYQNRPLVKKVILAHIEYLEEGWKAQNK